MSDKVRVKNGGSLRHERIMNIIGFIAMGGQDGVTLLDIQSYVLVHYGLKFSTTVEYLRECHMAGFIRPKEGGWIVTDRWNQFKRKSTHSRGESRGESTHITKDQKAPQ